MASIWNIKNTQIHKTAEFKDKDGDLVRVDTTGDTLWLELHDGSAGYYLAALDEERAVKLKALVDDYLTRMGFAPQTLAPEVKEKLERVIQLIRGVGEERTNDAVEILQDLLK